MTWNPALNCNRSDDMDPAVILEPDGFFRAIDRNNYDVDCDHTGFYSMSPTGYGRTPLDAIVNLLDNTKPLVITERSTLTHANGAPMFTADGMLLDDQGNRSIFDDVDE